MRNELQEKIEGLDIGDRAALYKLIEDFIFKASVDISVEENDISSKLGNTCPHCHSVKTRKNGYEKGIQRFVCNMCKKNFRSSTGLITMNLKKKEKLKEYIPFFLQGLSIQKCSEAVGISIQTSFDWRHKILAALGKFQSDTKLTGVIEADEIFFEQSSKGQKVEGRTARKRGKSISVKKKRGVSNDKVAVIVGCDRSGNKIMKVATLGRISTNDVKQTFENNLQNPTVLCTDGHRSYEGFAKEQELEHQTVKVSAKEYVKNGKYHVQHVNQTASESKKWLDRFNGVSSKYLQNYMNWFVVKKVIEKQTNQLATTVGIIVSAQQAYNIYQKISETYNMLIRI